MDAFDGKWSLMLLQPCAPSSGAAVTVPAAERALALGGGLCRGASVKHFDPLTGPRQVIPW
jgi:hypothetical protein